MTLSGAPADCSDHPTWRLIVRRHRTAIKFLPCGWLSHNRNDIAHRYCSRCHRFIEDERVTPNRD